MNTKIQKYLNQFKSSSFSELLFSYIDSSGLTDAEVYKKVFIDRKLFSKIRCNENYIPKKENIIKLGLSLSLNKEKMNKLLSSAGYSLSTTNDFDLIISFCIENNIYDITVVNDYLYTFGSTILN
jgi:hypothetical protein